MPRFEQTLLAILVSVTYSIFDDIAFTEIKVVGSDKLDSLYSHLTVVRPAHFSLFRAFADGYHFVSWCFFAHIVIPDCVKS